MPLPTASRETLSEPGSTTAQAPHAPCNPNRKRHRSTIPEEPLRQPSEEGAHSKHRTRRCRSAPRRPGQVSPKRSPPITPTGPKPGVPRVVFRTLGPVRRASRQTVLGRTTCDRPRAEAPADRAHSDAFFPRNRARIPNGKPPRPRQVPRPTPARVQPEDSVQSENRIEPEIFPVPACPPLGFSREKPASRLPLLRSVGAMHRAREVSAEPASLSMKK